MNKFNELIIKLREILQIDSPELDFGIYRIINARSAEINAFLTDTLPAKVAAALKAEGDSGQAEKQKELDQLVATLNNAGVDPEASPKVKDVREALKQYSAGTIDYESRVYAHLLQFFSRYYDNGDFISKRRYKGDTYAIPYSGEEVSLYWANFDQYYTKSGENFSNYTLKLDGGTRVHFKLVAADTAKDNRKDNDLDRCFVLYSPQNTPTGAPEDPEGEDGETPSALPQDSVEFKDGDLTLYFEYKPMPKGTKQAELIQDAIKIVTARFKVMLPSAPALLSQCIDELSTLCPTEKNPSRTRLEKELSNYTSKNKADYFIHKDLGKFLRRELDFYIKNEMMNLDDIQSIKTFKEIEKNLKMIQCMRSIADDLITFMAQLEDFQKKLWLKKKFVVETHWCITLDRVPEALFPLIAQSDAQMKEWVKLGFIEEAQIPGLRKWLLKCAKEGRKHESKDAPKDLFGNTDSTHRPQPSAFSFFMVIDTAFFDDTFKQKLLASIPNLDEQCDGLLVQSENSQALHLLQERYKRQIECIYIDPPYNTNDASFIYKNNYKHSSWGAMTASAISAGNVTVSECGVTAIAIDDLEQPFLASICDGIFSPEHRLGTLVVEIKPSGRTNDNFFATSHEYLLFYGETPANTEICFFPLTEEQKAQYAEADGGGQFKWRDFIRTGGYSTPEERPNSCYPIYYNEKTKAISLQKTQGDVEILPIDSEERMRVWRKTPASFLKHLADGEIKVNRNKDGRWKIQIIDRIKPGMRPKSVWVGSKYDASSHGTKLLKQLFGANSTFSFPKSIFAVSDCLYTVVGNAESDATVLDYFAGSGTTGHAVINLNREDAGKRKYILVEMGDHFDTVLKPRIQKVVYSPDWKDGKPTASEKGISHCFKYLRLESYEDTLNNLELKRTEAEGELLKRMNAGVKSEYLLKYMLEIESRGAVLSTDSFRKPFDYELDVAADSAGATTRRKIDLVETFNYLIGLRVKTYDLRLERGIAIIEGTLPDGQRALVLWRDCEKVGYEVLNQYCDSLKINPRSSDYDVVYVNGDHGIPNQTQTLESEGGITKVLKLRQIEEEFLTRMFEEG